MAMTQGSVSVSGGGIATGTGYALTLYNNRIAAITLPNPASPPTGFSADDVNAANLATKQAMAAQANVDAGIIGYIQGNGVARVKADATGDAVQNGTVHPLVDKDIPIF